MKIIDIIRESTEEISIYGKRVLVFRNPTVPALIMASKRKVMRGLVDKNTGDTYWWPASAAIHASAAIALGLSNNIDEIYLNDGLARLESLGNAIQIISGWKTVVKSSSMRYLTTHGMGIKRGKEVISFDDYLKLVTSYE